MTETQHDELVLLKLEHIDKSLLEIKEHVARTNGRVSALEKWKYGLLVGLGTLAATKWPIMGVVLNHVVGGM